MADKNINHKFRMKNIEEKRSYFIKEIDQYALMNKMHK